MLGPSWRRVAASASGRGSMLTWEDGFCHFTQQCAEKGEKRGGRKQWRI